MTTRSYRRSFGYDHSSLYMEDHEEEDPEIDEEDLNFDEEDEFPHHQETKVHIDAVVRHTGDEDRSSLKVAKARKIL
ncbi:hypothetical protein V6N13_028577 [Hibiscus sabdariffa]|uniref:Uncharacterized protein n=2 Tax=Hibiscus sabdariffa TaxID=183260 RepID=A0ABR2AWQ8_9ROSI